MQRRTDWLRELRGVLLVAAIVSAAFTIASAVITVTGGSFAVGVPAREVLDTGTVHGLPAGVAVDPDLNLYLRVSAPNAEQRLLAMVATAPQYLLTTTMLLLLWRLVSRATRQQPFTAGIARRLHVLGWLAVVGGPAVYAIGFVARFALSSTVTASGAAAATLAASTTTVGDLATPAIWLLAGFAFLAIAEIVRRGQALRSELDEVV
jgi:Protein of unknown function (DUF2975)